MESICCLDASWDPKQSWFFLSETSSQYPPAVHQGLEDKDTEPGDVGQGEPWAAGEPWRSLGRGQGQRSTEHRKHLASGQPWKIFNDRTTAPAAPWG